LGLALTALFAARLRFPRRLFLVPYVFSAVLFVASYLLWSDTDFVALLANKWQWGLAAGVLVGALTVANVRSQPTSRQAAGGELLGELAWLGLVYGLADALFLNIFPVIAVWNGATALGWTGTLWGAIATAFLGLIASLVVTLFYHAGYVEFRNQNMARALVGNSMITLAYLVSGNPLGAIVAHVVMHLAAVLQGPETTIQLPPHLAGQE
jgi:hypothetical protein